MYFLAPIASCLAIVLLNLVLATATGFAEVFEELEEKVDVVFDTDFETGLDDLEEEKLELDLEKELELDLATTFVWNTTRLQGKSPFLKHTSTPFFEVVLKKVYFFGCPKYNTYTTISPTPLF